MADQKRTRRKTHPTISEAPPPITPIRGSSIPTKSKPANYAHWNRFPLLRFDQCAYLAINVEPGTPIRNSSDRKRYEQICQLIRAHQRAGTLPYRDIEPLTFIKWLTSSGEARPKQWQPMTGTSIIDQRLAEGMEAAIDLLRQEFRAGRVQDENEFKKLLIKDNVIRHLRQHQERWPTCARTSPVRKEGNLKDREPTLSKNFPNFSQHSEILSEYHLLRAGQNT